MPLLPLRRRACRVSRSGLAATSAAVTKRWAPDVTSVMTMAARRAARSALSDLRMSRRIGSNRRLNFNSTEANHQTKQLPLRFHLSRLGERSEFAHFAQISGEGDSPRA